MKFITQSYEEFLNEDHAPTAWSASLSNTLGMGNVSTVNGTFTSNFSDISSGDQDGTKAFHTDLVIEDDGTDGWMRPSGDYSKRNWLLPNFVQYMNLHQSNARFQIGDSVVCVDPNMGCYGKKGRIVAFEDNTIRFEIHNSETGVGQTAQQYRCVASCLKKTK
jgi:hypothetical protein